MKEFAFSKRKKKIRALEVEAGASPEDVVKIFFVFATGAKRRVYKVFVEETGG